MSITELSNITACSNSTTNNSIIKTYCNIVDEDSNTSLHYHAVKNDTDNLTKEIENGHKIDPENYLGWTPLMMAAKKGHLNAVKLLISHRADATRKNKFGVSVFSVSVTSGNLEMVHLLLQHLLSGGVSRQSLQSIISPVSLSVLFSHIDVLNYLISQSFDLNCPTPITGITPLMFASAMDNCQAFSLLLTKNANPNIRNCLGSTAHEITHFNQRKELTTNNPMVPPLIVISPSYLCPTPGNFTNIRKSSSTFTPDYLPLISPITPLRQTHAQLFFPPNFSPRQNLGALSPGIRTINQFDNDVLNSRLHTSMVSPFLRQDIEDNNND